MVNLIYRPGVAGAVLQTPLPFIKSLSQYLTDLSFSSKSSKLLPSQTIRAKELMLWENVHHPILVTCQVSHVTCHMSGVTVTFYSRRKRWSLSEMGLFSMWPTPSSFWLYWQHKEHQQINQINQSASPLLYTAVGFNQIMKKKKKIRMFIVFKDWEPESYFQFQPILTGLGVPPFDIFSLNWPLGRFSLLSAMSVDFLCVYEEEHSQSSNSRTMCSFTKFS